MDAKNLFALVFIAVAPAHAAPADPFGEPVEAKALSGRYTPPSRFFTCQLPAGWTPFEEDEGGGVAVHILGPENPGGTFRSGLSVRYMEKGQPGYMSFKKILEDLRRPDEATKRTATGIRPLRTGAGLARVFEINETRRLPPDRLPSIEEALHRYVAIIPANENYYIVTLASTRDTYLDYKDLFVEFLRTFHPS